MTGHYCRYSPVTDELTIRAQDWDPGGKLRWTRSYEDQVLRLHFKKFWHVEETIDGSELPFFLSDEVRAAVLLGMACERIKKSLGIWVDASDPMIKEEFNQFLNVSKYIGRKAA